MNSLFRRSRLRRSPSPAARRLRRPTTHTSGFTLVEVLVAMILLGVGVMGAMRAVGMSTRASAQARDSLLAATLAQGITSELVRSPELATGTESGDFSPDHPQYRWESDVEESTDTTGLLTVNVTVFWADAQVERNLSIATMVLDPSTQTTTTDTTDTGATTGTTTGTGAAGG